MNVRAEFPCLKQKPYGLDMVYLDSAATSLKPQSVIDAEMSYYTSMGANVHRGTHYLSEIATAAYEGAREKVRAFIGADAVEEIVFTRGTTDAINLIAQTFGRTHLKEGDEIVVSHMEHHSNIVPWQMVCEQTGAKLKVIPITDAGELDFDAFLSMLSGRVKLVAICHVSNALGTINPISQVIKAAHAQSIPVLIDGAQAVHHLPVSVKDLDCDFYVFSSHKMYGPTGVGVLYAKRPWLETLPPYQGGGDMIASVTFEKTTYAKPPIKFEAGTPNIAGVIGLGAAIDFLSRFDFKQLLEHESLLVQKAHNMLEQIRGISIVGKAKHKIGVVSFVLKDIHPHDISSILDRAGVAIRGGHLCTQPLMRRFGVPALARASFGIYNTLEDVDRLAESLVRVKEVFHVG